MEELEHDIVAFLICIVSGIILLGLYAVRNIDIYLAYSIFSFLASIPFLIAIFLDIKDIKKNYIKKDGNED